MKDNIIRIETYLGQLVGRKIFLEEVPKGVLSDLALQIKKGFVLYQSRLLEYQVVFAFSVDGVKLSPGRAYTVTRAISAKIGVPVVLVIEQVVSYLIRRYIEKRVPFLIPSGQLYIPRLLLDLGGRNQSEPEKRTYFRPSTQFFILYHLLVKKLGGLSQVEIASLLHYSVMTVSRIIKECVSKGILIDHYGSIEFIMKGNEIWNTSQEYFKSPVRKEVYTNAPLLLKDSLLSGSSALAFYTSLVGDQQQTVAIGAEKLNILSRKNKGKFNSKIGAVDHLIQVWNYDPNLLTSTTSVDPLSLYLSVEKEGLDEKIALELDKLLDFIND